MVSPTSIRRWAALANGLKIEITNRLAALSLFADLLLITFLFDAMIVIKFDNNKNHVFNPLLLRQGF